MNFFKDNIRKKNMKYHFVTVLNWSFYLFNFSPLSLPLFPFSLQFSYLHKKTHVILYFSIFILRSEEKFSDDILKFCLFANVTQKIRWDFRDKILFGRSKGIYWFLLSTDFWLAKIRFFRKRTRFFQFSPGLGRLR